MASVKPFMCAYGDNYGIEAEACLGEIEVRTGPDSKATLSITDARALAEWLLAAADAEAELFPSAVY